MKLSDLNSLPKDESGPVFAEPWEAQAFAMAVKLNDAGVFTWSEWAETLGAEIRAEPDRGYYGSWLAALERLVEAKGLIGTSERLERIDGLGRSRARHAAWPADRTQPIVASQGNCSMSQ